MGIKFIVTKTPFIGLIAGLLFLSAAPASADGDCIPMGATASNTIIGPVAPSDDPAAIGNIVYHFPDGDQNAAVTGFIVSEPKVAMDGSMQLLLRLVHTFSPADSITWMADLHMTPTVQPGLFDFSEDIGVISSTGIFSETLGKGLGGGTISFLDGAVLVSASGYLCNVPDFGDSGDGDSDSGDANDSDSDE